MLKHIHISENSKEVADCFSAFGKTPVELLEEIVFLDNKTIAAHCVKIDEKDIGILSKNGVHVATNPSSNFTKQLTKLQQAFLQVKF